MHPPLLISTAGRRKNQRFKGSSEGGSTTRIRGSKGVVKEVVQHAERGIIDVMSVVDMDTVGTHAKIVTQKTKLSC